MPLVAGKLVLLAPNQVVALPPSMLTNLTAPRATPQLVHAPQNSASQAPGKQIVITCASNQDSQGIVASVQNTTMGNSVGVPPGLTTLATKTTAAVTSEVSTVVVRSAHSKADDRGKKTSCTAVSSTPTISSLATAVSSLPLPANSTSVAFKPLLTSSTAAFPVISLQTSSGAQSNLAASSLVSGAQVGMLSHFTASKNVNVAVPGANKPFSNTVNTSLVNISATQQESLLVNGTTSAVSLTKEPSSTVWTSPSLNVQHIKATTNQSSVLSNTSQPLLSIINNKPQPIPVTVSTQISQATSSSVLSTLNNVPWSAVSQTCTSTNIQSQTQTVQPSALQSTNPSFPPATNLDSTSAVACSTFSLTDSVASTAAPLDNSLDICSMAEDGTAPTLMSPQSLQSMLQSMLTQSDAQLLWNTMFNSPMMQSPIFKFADTSNSTATTTSTATESYPRTSPLEQFPSQQSSFIPQAPQQNNDMIPESIQDAFSDLNVQGVTEQDRLAEEVIFSSILSSKAKGSGYGLGIDIEELLDNAGIVQDPALSNL